MLTVKSISEIKDSCLLELDVGKTLQIIFLFINHLDCFIVNHFLSRLALVRYKHEPELALILLLVSGRETLGTYLDHLAL